MKSVVKKAMVFFFSALLSAFPTLALAEELTAVDDLAGVAAISALHEAWKDESGNIDYPADYAGAYLRDGGRNAVVLIASLTAAREAELRALVPEAEIEFVSARYTYDELMSTLNEVAADMAAPLSVRGVLGVGLDEANNAVAITVNTADEAAAREYYTKKYGDRITVEATDATAYVPMTDAGAEAVKPPQTGGKAAPYGLLLMLLAAFALCLHSGKQFKGGLEL